MSSSEAASIASLAAALADLRLEAQTLRTEVASIRETLSSEGRTPVVERTCSEVSSESSFVLASEAGYRVGSERQAACRVIGRWVTRCLAGENAGASGRERIQQSSRYYLIFKDFDHQVYNPPLVFTSWSQCKSLVVRSGQSGDSIYIGLPSQEEARIVIETARLSIPPALHGRSGRA